jgi:hypothetical protein
VAKPVVRAKAHIVRPLAGEVLIIGVNFPVYSPVSREFEQRIVREGLDPAPLSSLLFVLLGTLSRNITFPANKAAVYGFAYLRDSLSRGERDWVYRESRSEAGVDSRGADRPERRKCPDRVSNRSGIVVNRPNSLMASKP